MVSFLQSLNIPKLFELDKGGDLRCYILDCHRPIHLANIHSRFNVVIFDDAVDGEFETVPSDGPDLSDMGQSSSDEDEEESEDLEEDDDDEEGSGEEEVCTFMNFFFLAFVYLSILYVFVHLYMFVLCVFPQLVRTVYIICIFLIVCNFF